MTEKMESDSPGDSGEIIHKALKSAASDGELPCSAAFEVAESLNISPAVIGDYADKLGLHLARCQLGLFGYKPDKKIVKPLESVDASLAAAIRQGLDDNRLPCKTAWEIAERFKIPRMAVGAACESLGVKIKRCQIGAF